MENLFYKPEDGDEIFFMPNFFMSENSGAIKDISTKVGFMYNHMFLCDITSPRNNWEFFISHPNFNADLYGLIRGTINQNKNNGLNSNGKYYCGQQYLSIIQFNNKLMLFKYGKKINDAVKEQWIKDPNGILGWNIKKLIIQFRTTGGFPNYDGTRFSKDTYDTMFKNEKEYLAEVKNAGVKHYLTNFFNANFMHNKINSLYRYLKMHGFENVYKDPNFNKLFVKYDRSAKLKEIMSDDDL